MQHKQSKHLFMIVLMTKKKYKTASNVQLYNNFLKTLDNKALNIKQLLFPIEDNKSVEKDVLDSVIDKIDENYKNNKFDNKYYNGIMWEKESKPYLNEYENLSSTWGFNEHIKKFLERQPELGRSSFFDNELLIKKNEMKEKKDNPKKKVDILCEIHSITDLLELIEQNKLDEEVEYNIDMKSLHNIKEPLQDLNNMIGMDSLKQNIVDQILYFIQSLHKPKNADSKYSGDYMHTVIYGPPGTGKTEVAKLMGNIFSNMGILKKGIFKKVTRSDLIAGYLGQTAIKTNDIIKECLGGVLFIDEAYALGNAEKRDSFSKECIDTLCEALSNNKDNLMVIIAGYEEELKNCFFNYNQGLDSRFTWRFKTVDYKAEELYKIFILKLQQIGWNVHVDHTEKINSKWFDKHLIYFKFFGRDIETFISRVKICHSKRVFCLPESEKTLITYEDLDKGMKEFLKNDEVKNRKDGEEMKFRLSGIYV